MSIIDRIKKIIPVFRSLITYTQIHNNTMLLQEVGELVITV